MQRQQDNIIVDQKRLREECIQFKTIHSIQDSDLKKDILLNMRKSLSTAIEKMNNDISYLKEQESTLNAKSKALQNIERVHRKYEQNERNFNKETLKELYCMYKQIEMKTIDNENKSQYVYNSIFDDNRTIESQYIGQNMGQKDDFYRRWNQMLKSHLTIQNEDDDIMNHTVNESNNLQKKGFIDYSFSVIRDHTNTDITKENYSKNTILTNPTRTIMSSFLEQNTIDGDLQNYNRIKKIVKKKDVIQTAFAVQKNWLDSMKIELNRQLLNRSPLQMTRGYLQNPLY